MEAMSNGIQTDAQMDPWCIVALVDGVEVLLGFATYHPGTGGLSWSRSTPIRHLGERTGYATTQSGRHYALGRRIAPAEITLEGEEDWWAYDLLIGADAADGPNFTYT